MNDLGTLRYFGLEISLVPQGIALSQQKYIFDILDRADISDKKIVDAMLQLNVKLIPNDGESLVDHTCYIHLVG